MKLNKKNKIIIGAVAGLIVLGGVGIGVKVSADHDYKKNVSLYQEQLKNELVRLGEVKTEADSLFFADDTAYLAKDLTQEQIDVVQKDVSSDVKVPNKYAKEKELKKLDTSIDDVVKEITDKLTLANAKFEFQNEVNAGFENLVLNGNAYTDSIAVKADSAEDYFSKIQTEFTTKFTDTKDHWVATLTKALDNGQSQVTAYVAGTKVVAGLNTAGKVKAGVTRTEYDNANKLVGVLKDGSKKKTLADLLVPVLAQVESDEKKVAEAEKAKQETEVAQNNSFSADSNNDTSSDYSSDTNSNSSSNYDSDDSESYSSGSNDSNGNSSSSSSSSNSNSSSSSNSSSNGSSSTDSNSTDGNSSSDSSKDSVYAEYTDGGEDEGKDPWSGGSFDWPSGW